MLLIDTWMPMPKILLLYTDFKIKKKDQLHFIFTHKQLVFKSLKKHGYSTRKKVSPHSYFRAAIPRSEFVCVYESSYTHTNSHITVSVYQLVHCNRWRLQRCWAYLSWGQFSWYWLLPWWYVRISRVPRTFSHLIFPRRHTNLPFSSIV